MFCGTGGSLPSSPSNREASAISAAISATFLYVLYSCACVHVSVCVHMCMCVCMSMWFTYSVGLTRFLMDCFVLHIGASDVIQLFGHLWSVAETSGTGFERARLGECCPGSAVSHSPKWCNYANGRLL